MYRNASPIFLRNFSRPANQAFLVAFGQYEGIQKSFTNCAMHDTLLQNPIVADPSPSWKQNTELTTPERGSDSWPKLGVRSLLPLKLWHFCIKFVQMCLKWMFAPPARHPVHRARWRKN